MDEQIINQPLREVTIFQCPQCSRIIRNALTRQPYGCPWGCPSHLIVLRTEWEEQGATTVPLKQEQAYAEHPSRFRA